MDNTKLKNFLQDLDCELSEEELAVISCLREHLIDYIPNHINPEQSVNSEINRVIDNYRLRAFEDALLYKRIDSKFKNNYDIDIQTKKEGN